MKELLVSLVVAVCLLLISVNVADDSDRGDLQVSMTPPTLETPSPLVAWSLPASYGILGDSVSGVSVPHRPPVDQMIGPTPDFVPTPVDSKEETTKPELYALPPESGADLLSRLSRRPSSRLEAELKHFDQTALIHRLWA